MTSDLTDGSRVFTMDLPEMPPGIWTRAEEIYPELPQLDSRKMQACLYDVAAACWRLGVALFLHATWRWRVEHFDSLNDITEMSHKARFASRLQQGYRTIHLYLREGNSQAGIARAARVLRDALQGGHQYGPPRQLTGRGRYVLFFDGGSRGNPGPGGAGAVIIHVGESIMDLGVCWVASISLKHPTTTNNKAEYVGLLTGLTACKTHHWAPVHVVGDSMLIISQQRQRKPAKARKLNDLYWRCRTIADQLNVTSWMHHLRAYNKMADRLANLAMDSETSCQTVPVWPTVVPSKWTPTLEHLPGDIGHWLERNPASDATAPVASIN